MVNVHWHLRKRLSVGHSGGGEYLAEELGLHLGVVREGRERGDMSQKRANS